MWVFAELHATYYEQMAEQWNEKNPDRPIDLEVTVYPYDDMHNKLQLAVNSGSGPAGRGRHRGQPVLELRRGGRQVRRSPT